MLKINNVTINLNSIYKKADSDEDGISDEIDNCVLIANENQKDIDGNDRGDACDDFDRDGVLNPDDNCPNNPNRYQKDEDVDGIGDVCDEEENRFFARHSWLPMTLIIFVGAIIVGLFLLTFKKEE
ncbi:MAG: thrombospondin type 3 repeat-containing protein [Candidatus Moranbacteria bacterium]|nr:thrombospondin type 3 repeat-containing protein [Candidatus Moranbacteria bacterium]